MAQNIPIEPTEKMLKIQDSIRTITENMDSLADNLGFTYALQNEIEETKSMRADIQTRLKSEKDTHTLADLITQRSTLDDNLRALGEELNTATSGTSDKHLLGSLNARSVDWGREYRRLASESASSGNRAVFDTAMQALASVNSPFMNDVLKYETILAENEPRALAEANKTAIDANRGALEAHSSAIDANRAIIDSNGVGIDANSAGIAENRRLINFNWKGIQVLSAAVGVVAAGAAVALGFGYDRLGNADKDIAGIKQDYTTREDVGNVRKDIKTLTGAVDENNASSSANINALGDRVSGLEQETVGQPYVDGVVQGAIADTNAYIDRQLAEIQAAPAATPAPTATATQTPAATPGILEQAPQLVRYLDMLRQAAAGGAEVVMRAYIDDVANGGCDKVVFTAQTPEGERSQTFQGSQAYVGGIAGLFGASALDPVQQKPGTQCGDHTAFGSPSFRAGSEGVAQTLTGRLESVVAAIAAEPKYAR